MGIYFEDYNAGDVFVSPTRTITETDVVNFATLTGDMNEIHTSETYAAGTPFGARLAHGLLGLSIAHGLMFRLGLTDGTGIAFLSMDEWHFKVPVFIGDTVHVRVEVLETVPSSRRSDRGVVKFLVQLRNADEVVTQEGTKTIMFKAREWDG